MPSWSPETYLPRKNRRQRSTSHTGRSGDAQVAPLPGGRRDWLALAGGKLPLITFQLDLVWALAALLCVSAIILPPPSTAWAASATEAPAPAAATAEEETRLPVRSAPKPLDPTPAPGPSMATGHMNLSHEDQIGLALMPGSGYRLIVPYKDMLECGQLGKRVCTGRIPWFLDVEPSFGLSQGWDVLVTLRFGIESDFHTHRQFAVMPGLRYWLDRDTALRLYATLQFVYDQADQNQAAVSNSDFGFRNANGFLYDVVRNFSLYFQFGETVGFKRWFRFEMDGGVGLQVRLP